MENIVAFHEICIISIVYPCEKSSTVWTIAFRENSA